MPELYPTWEALCERAGGGDVAARVLSLYDPPPLLAGCSQAVIGGALVRNYDYHPDRIEGTVLRQRDPAARAGDERLPVGPARRRQRRRPGGRAGVGRPPRARAGVRDHAGRALPARGLRDGRAGRHDARAPPGPRALQPHAGGRARAARRPSTSGPDRAARVVLPAVATNHQEQVDWPEHAQATRSVERHAALLRAPPTRAPSWSRRCTRPSSRAASARSTPRSTAPAAARSPTAGRARAGSSRWRLYARHAERQTLRAVQTALVLGDLVAQEDLGLTLLSGGAGALDREVAGAHSIDVEEPTRFLERRWVMLTAGMRLKGSVAAQRGLIAELDEGGMSALGIGVDLVFKRVPPALLEEARERAFPVLAVPLGTAVPRHRRLHQPLAALQRPAHLPAAERDPAPPRRRAARAAPARGDGRAPGADARRRRAAPRARRATSRPPAGRCPDHDLAARIGEREFEHEGWHVVSVPIGDGGWLAVASRGRALAARLARPAAQAAVPLLAATDRLDDLARDQERAIRSAPCSTRRWRAGETSARWPRGWRPSGWTSPRPRGWSWPASRAAGRRRTRASTRATSGCGTRRS